MDLIGWRADSPPVEECLFGFFGPNAMPRNVVKIPIVPFEHARAEGV